MKLDAFMKAFFSAIFLLVTTTFSQVTGEKVPQRILAGYYADWSIWNTPSYSVDLVPYRQLTHVIWSFIYPDANGNLSGDAIDDPTELDLMVSQAHAVGTKAIISLGGAGQCKYFAPVSKNDKLRSNFVKKLTNFVAAHNLDGVDMDWEFDKVPVASEDTAGYNKLLTEIRASLPQGVTLSAALPCSDYYGKYFTAEVLLANLDWFGLMTYDITGDWDDKARFDSPLFPNSKWTTWSWTQSAAYWTKRGVPASKMVMGIPSFGFVFYGATGPGSDFDTAEQESYAEILKLANWDYYYDDVSKEPYGIAEHKFVTFENAQSTAAKAIWIYENNYAGAMIWELSHDYMETETQPIVSTASRVLLEGNISIGKKRDLLTPQAARASYTYDALGKYAGNKKAGIRNRTAKKRYYNR